MTFPPTFYVLRPSHMLDEAQWPAAYRYLLSGFLAARAADLRSWQQRDQVNVGSTNSRVTRFYLGHAGRFVTAAAGFNGFVGDIEPALRALAAS